MVAALAVPVAGALGISTTAASVGLSLAAYAATTAASIFLQMSMMEEQQQDIGTKLSALQGGAVNQSIHVGRKETAGSFLYINTWGRSGRVPNAFLVRVYCLSDRRVEGFEDYIWAGGKKCNYDPGETQIIDGNNVGHPINAFKAGGENRLWVKFHDGSQTTADSYLVDKFGSDGSRPWTANHVGRGRAYMIVTQKYDKKQPEGEVEVVAVIKNSRYYDWRSDSTNGGSGGQRYGNVGTYGLETGNPVVTIYNVMRGIYEGDEWLYGGQSWPASRFDNDSWTAAANKCDEDVDLAGGGTQKRFRIGAEIDLSEEPWAVIARCLKACNGRIVESGGVYKIYVGGIGASVMSFTDDDIMISEELTGRMFPTRDGIYNTVTGTYVEPDSAGEPKAFKARTKNAYVKEDGDVRKTTLDLDYVRDNRQAQRVANLALKDNRRFRTFSVAFWTAARKLEPCDVVRWTSARFGFTSKKFILGDVVLREDGIVIANLREADDSDADWTTLDEDAYELGVFEDIDPPTQTLVATVTAGAITDDDGSGRRPAIRIQATLDDDFVDCRALRYQVRKKNGDQKLIFRGRSQGFFEPDSDAYGDIIFTDNSFLPGRDVQVRYKIEPESDRNTNWSAWADGNVTLTNHRFTDDDLDDSSPAAPTGLTLTKVQDTDEDGKVQTFIKMVCTPPAWANAKTTYVFAVTVGSDTFTVKSDDEKARFRVQKTGVPHTVKVRGIKGTGNKGAWSADETITPTKKATGPGVATGLQIERKTGANNLKWDRCTDPDYKETIVYRNTIADFATATEIDRVAGTFYRDRKNLTKGVNYKYWVVHVNWSGIAASAAPPTVNVDYDLITLTDTNTDTLAAPTGISLSQANRDVDKDGTVDIALLASFSGGVSGAAGYECWYEDNTGQTATVRADGGKLWFAANTQRSYRCRWRTISWNGQPGAWSSYTSYVTPSPTAGAPAAPSGVAASGYQLGFYIVWNNPSELDYSYTEIATRLSAGTPDDASIMASRSANYGFIFSPTGDNQYVYVRHVNTSGARSAWTLASGSPVSIKPAKAGHMVTENLGTSGGSVNPGLGDETLLLLTFRCTSNTSGVDVTLGSKTFPSVEFVNNETRTFHSSESGGGSFSVSKSGGGTWANVTLTAVTINNP